MRDFILYSCAIVFFSACNSNCSLNNIPTSIDTISLSKTVLPSEDFFLFANEKWLSENNIPDHKEKWGSFDELDQQNNQKLIQIVNECFQQQVVDKKNANSKQFKDKDLYERLLIGQFYGSYIDTNHRNSLGILPINKELNAIKDIQSKEALVDIIANMHQHGINVLFGLNVRQDLKNTKKHALYFHQSGIGLPNRNYYTDKDKISVQNAYKKFISDGLNIINYNVNTEAINKEIYRIEEQLATSMLRPEERRNPDITYNKLSKNEVCKKFTHFPFESYLHAMNIHNIDSIIVDNPHFIEQINKMLNKESLQTWKSYLTWHLFHHYMNGLDKQCTNLYFQFHGKILSDKKKQEAIAERGVKQITYTPLAEALGKIFAFTYFSENDRLRINQMIDNLKSAYQERIQQLNWMSETTKQEALNKLDAISRKIAYPDQWRDIQSLRLNENTYIENKKTLTEFARRENLEKLNRPVDLNEWYMPAYMVNAYYSSLFNEIVFPAGILQPPFFDPKAEDAINYGRIGMVIGHELTHGFDDMGSKFASDGSYKNWWTPSDRKTFEKQTEILGETYSSFCPIDNTCINEKLTMGENIADLGGITMAYYAYTKTDEFKRQEKINNYTPQQRFFIAYAQLWRIKYTDAELKKRLANDSHSPGMYRVNGVLMNCPEFFESFNIAEGAKMRNKKEKIAIIW